MSVKAEHRGGSVGPQNHALFVYGTLQIPLVMRAVTGREYDAVPAVLEGWARYRVRGESYPGIVEERGGSTAGCLVLGLDDATLRRVDAFEGDLYVRRRVTVVTADGERADAWTYVVPHGRRARLSRRPWNLAGFERRHLRAFLTGYAGFRRRDG